MGGIRKFRKKTISPGHPYDKVRIERELPLVGEYGLRNKKELWKARTVLSKARQQARELLALDIDARKQREEELLSRLSRLGMLSQGSDLDSVLALDVKTVLNRRLQTLVYRKGLAASPYQARQFITHRHIAIGDGVATSPGRIITVNEEGSIQYAPLSPLTNETHPSRPKAPPVFIEGEGEARVKPKSKKELKAKIKTKIEPEIEDELEAVEEIEEEEEEEFEEEIIKPEPKPTPKPQLEEKKEQLKKEEPKPKVQPKKPEPKKEEPKPKVQPKKPEPMKEEPKPKAELKPAPTPQKEKPPVSDVELTDIEGVGDKTAMLLKEGGFDTVEKIASAALDDLVQVPGIGRATGAKMIETAKSLLKGGNK